MIEAEYEIIHLPLMIVSKWEFLIWNLCFLTTRLRLVWCISFNKKYNDILYLFSEKKFYYGKNGASTFAYLELPLLCMTGITSCISWDGRRLLLIWSMEKWQTWLNLSLIFDDLLTRQIWALAFPSNFAPQHKYPTRKKHKGT
jgi:hypothetical protein